MISLNELNEKRYNRKIITIENVDKKRLPFYRALFTEEILRSHMQKEQDNLICSGAHIDGQPVAIVTSSIHKKGNKAELHYIYVHKTFRRLGIGTLLLYHLEKKLYESSCATVYISVVMGISNLETLEKFFHKHHNELSSRKCNFLYVTKGIK